MVICKYFLNGSCRFGAKCVNEHLDVKQLLKSDVESAVNGNQWPLSCFGPFKEKPSIPNFIEDQSFEEIRMLCYGSKKQNFFDTFNQQFSKEVMEAKNKMKMLLTLNKEVMDIVLNIYNSSEPPKSNNQNTNPFGMGTTSNTQQNTNLFGSSSNTQNNIFGKTTVASPFGASNNASSGGSVFGGGQKPLLGQSAFGSFTGQQQSQPQQQGGNLFNSIQPQQQPANAFGGSIFSQQVQQTPVGGGSIFGAAQLQQPQQTQQHQSFGGTSIFGQQQPTSGNIFTQAAQQPQQPTIGANIFNQTPQQAPPQPQSFGLFSQATQQPPPPAFGTQMTQQSPFGAAQQQQQQGNMFGLGQQQYQQQPQLQQQPQQQQQPQLQQQNQPIADAFNSQPQQYQTHQNPTGLFSVAAAANTNFGGTQPQQPHPNIFAQASASFPQQQQQIPPSVSDRTYSKMENLTPEEIEAFKADTFELGKIPFSPPPRELLN